MSEDAGLCLCVIEKKDFRMIEIAASQQQQEGFEDAAGFEFVHKNAATVKRLHKIFLKDLKYPEIRIFQATND